jgi:hypothetical protein
MFRSLRLFPIALLLCLPTVGFSQTELEKLNQEMLNFFINSGSTRSRDRTVLPATVKTAAAKLQTELGVKVYQTPEEMAEDGDKKNVIVQEFLRRDLKNGLPWLPLSWTREYYGNIEESYGTIIENLSKNLYRQSTLSNDDLVVGYLFNSSIPHLSNVGIIQSL